MRGDGLLGVAAGGDVDDPGGVVVGLVVFAGLHHDELGAAQVGLVRCGVDHIDVAHRSVESGDDSAICAAGRSIGTTSSGIGVRLTMVRAVTSSRRRADDDQVGGSAEGSQDVDGRASLRHATQRSGLGGRR